jgi:type VI secretion system secreted protein Hcp
MPIYMKCDGVDGSVTAAGHEKWIELLSCQFGVNRHITSPSGRGTNREASVPALSEIVVTKHLDAASSGLFRASLWGDGKKVKIDFCKTEKNAWEKYLEIEMENTLIASFNVSGHGGDSHERPLESLSLNFTKITFNAVETDPKNKSAKPDRIMWDLAQAKGS